MCVGVGMALVVEVTLCLESRSWPFACSSHTPGPVLRKRGREGGREGGVRSDYIMQYQHIPVLREVFIPLRKSGTEADNNGHYSEPYKAHN